MLQFDWMDSQNISRETTTMMTLFQYLDLSRLDYVTQLWDPQLLKSIYLIEKVQCSLVSLERYFPRLYNDRNLG